MNILKDIRERNELTQTEMAKRLEVSTQRYNSYERKRRNIPVDIAILIARTYKINLEDIFLGMD